MLLKIVSVGQLTSKRRCKTASRPLSLAYWYEHKVAVSCTLLQHLKCFYASLSVAGRELASIYAIDLLCIPSRFLWRLYMTASIQVNV